MERSETIKDGPALVRRAWLIFVGIIALIEAVVIAVALRGTARVGRTETKLVSVAATTFPSTMTSRPAATMSAATSGPWQSADMSAENLEVFARAFAASLDRQDRQFAAEDQAKDPGGRALDWQSEFSSSGLVPPDEATSTAVGRFWIHERYIWSKPGSSGIRGHRYALRFNVQVHDGIWTFVSGTLFTEPIESGDDPRENPTGPARSRTIDEVDFARQLSDANFAVSHRR